jgi:hypothetical protein
VEGVNELIDMVLTLDAQDANAVAYATTNVHFEFPAQPFLFWKDPNEDPQPGEWFEFEFPELALGIPPFHSSWTPGDFIDFIGFIDDIAEWIKFAVWVQQHSQTAANLNSGGASKFDESCEQACEAVIITFHFDECYTEESVETFCEIIGALGWCDDDLTDREKNSALAEAIPCHQEAQLTEVARVAYDWITMSWHNAVTILQL